MTTSSNSQNHAQVEHQIHWKKDSFVYCFRPIYVVSHIFGLMPFSIIFHSNGEVQKSSVSKFDILWFLTSLCLLLLGIYALLTVHPSIPKSYSMIAFLGETGIFVTVLILASLSIILGMCNRHKLINIVKKITMSDKEAQAMGIHFDYQQEYRQNSLFIAIAMGVTTILLIFSICTLDLYYTFLTKERMKELLISFTDSIEQYILVLITITFTILLRTLYKRFTMLNSFLT